MLRLIGINASQLAVAGGGFESIASVTAAGGETTLSFTSIPADYQHLQIRGIARTSRALAGTDSMNVTFNSDSGSNYSWHALTGDGSAAAAFAGASQTRIVILNGATMMNSSTANAFAADIIDIHDYANSSKNTTLRAFYGGDANTASTSFILGLSSGAWYNTSAVTTVSLNNGFGFEAGSTFALYGIKAAA